MESLPRDITRNFPLVLRMVSKKFRDDIDLFDHWIYFNDDSREWLLDFRLRVKYIVTEDMKIYWIFPNIVELKFPDFGEMCYTAQWNVDWDKIPRKILSLNQFKKLKKVFIQQYYVANMKDLKHIQFYVRNGPADLPDKSENIKYLHFIGRIDSTGNIKINTENYNIISFLLEKTEYKITLFWPHTMLRYSIGEYYSSVYKNRLFIDLADYNCKDGQELENICGLYGVGDKLRDMIENNVLTLIFPRRSSEEHYTDIIPDGEHIESLLMRLRFRNPGKAIPTDSDSEMEDNWEPESEDEYDYLST